MRFCEKAETEEPYIQISRGVERRCWSISRTYCNSLGRARINGVSYINLMRTKPQETTNRCCNLGLFLNNTAQHSFGFGQRLVLVKTDAVAKFKVAMACVKDFTVIWSTANLLLSEVVKTLGIFLKRSVMPTRWLPVSNQCRSTGNLLAILLNPSYEKQSSLRLYEVGRLL